MQELIAILENEIKAHQADYLRPGISQVEREQITATIRYKRERIAEFKQGSSPIKPEPKTDTSAVNQVESPVANPKGGATGDPLANPPPITQGGQKGDMWAFLTGVNKYENSLNFPKLDYCADDAEALAETLPKCGYADRIKLLTDKTGEPVTKGLIEEGFAAFASSNKVKPDDLLLFYYSGHGAADEQDTYLVSHSGYLNNLAKYAVKLSDILGSMRQSKARDLIDSARESTHFAEEHVEQYYFQNVVGEKLFTDPYLIQSVPFANVLSRCDNDTSILIISDAGAARGHYRPDRVLATTKFIAHLRRRTNQIAWLNPMPEERWAGTSAQMIAYLTPMLRMDQDGFSRAMDVARGITFSAVV